MCERALPMGPVARDTSGDRNELRLSVLVECACLLRLTEERNGFPREMSPVVAIGVRLEAPLSYRLQLVVTVLSNLAELFGRDSFPLGALRSLGHFAAPCPVDCFR